MIIIAAMTRDRVIGKDGRMPWHIPEEFRHFKDTTIGHTLIMGRRTFESIGRHLRGRNTIVVSRSLPELLEGVAVCRSLEGAIDKARSYGKEIFIAGGETIYRQALPLVNRMYLSTIEGHYGGDTYFPQYDGGEWEVVREEDHPGFVFAVYERKRPAGP